MTIISKSCFRQNTGLFNEVADIVQSDLVNSRTCKDLWNEIQGLSSTCHVFKYFQGLEFWRKKIQILSRMCGNPAEMMNRFLCDFPNVTVGDLAAKEETFYPVSVCCLTLAISRKTLLIRPS